MALQGGAGAQLVRENSSPGPLLVHLCSPGRTAGPRTPQPCTCATTCTGRVVWHLAAPWCGGGPGTNQQSWLGAVAQRWAIGARLSAPPHSSGPGPGPTGPV